MLGLAEDANVDVEVEVAEDCIGVFAPLSPELIDFDVAGLGVHIRFALGDSGATAFDEEGSDSVESDGGIGPLREPFIGRSE